MCEKNGAYWGAVDLKLEVLRTRGCTEQKGYPHWF